MRLTLYLQHILNPLHVYCRLVDIRIISPNTASKLCYYYEISIFKLIKKKISIESISKHTNSLIDS